MCVEVLCQFICGKVTLPDTINRVLYRACTNQKPERSCRTDSLLLLEQCLLIKVNAQ